MTFLLTGSLCRFIENNLKETRDISGRGVRNYSEVLARGSNSNQSRGCEVGKKWSTLGRAGIWVLLFNKNWGWEYLDPFKPSLACNPLHVFLGLMGFEYSLQM